MTKVKLDLQNKDFHTLSTRAIGPNDLESPRGDEAICMAP